MNRRKRRVHVLILYVVRLSVQDCFSVILDNICIEGTWIRESSFNMLRGLVEVLCACVRGALKNR